MDLETFRREFANRVSVRAEADSNFTDSAFMEVAADFLADAGEVSDLVLCHYRGLMRQRRLAVDGYAFDNADRSVRLFVLTRGDDFSLTQRDSETAFRRLRAFAEEALSGNLQSILDDHSPILEFTVELAERASSLSCIRAYILTDGIFTSRTKDFPDGVINGIPIEYHIWDISRFFRAYSSTTGQDDLEVEFGEFGIPCISASSDFSIYAGYLCVVPGNLLADIYKKYGSRLLEGNVRSFLSARGKINRGIRSTIVQSPGMFFAYNNGIAATATSVKIVQDGGGSRLLMARDFQIVNGGQTTASLASTPVQNTANLFDAYVPMKLTVIAAHQSDDLIPLISRFANSQNKVSEADFFSNHPYHRHLEQLSRRLWAPAKAGAQHETRWFYERARGQYLNELSNLSESKRRVFLEENPRAQLILKTDLAKSELSWSQHPQRVSRGAQSAFTDFASEITKLWTTDSLAFDEYYFRRIVARVILFRATERLVSSQPWYAGGYRANVVTYSIAKLAYETYRLNAHELDFLAIWQAQALPNVMSEQIAAISDVVFACITNPPAGHQNVTQWCKRDDCWDIIRRYPISLNRDYRLSLIATGEGMPSGLEDVSSETDLSFKATRVRIRQIEGFDVRLKRADGTAVDETEFAPSTWPYERAARSSWTTADWKRYRFAVHFPEFAVDVFDGNGDIVHGLRQLGSVRESYSE